MTVEARSLAPLSIFVFLCSLTYDDKLVGGWWKTDPCNITSLPLTLRIWWNNPVVLCEFFPTHWKRQRRRLSSPVSICAERRCEQLPWIDWESATRIHTYSLKSELERKPYVAEGYVRPSNLEFSSWLLERRFQPENGGLAADKCMPQSIDWSI